jgi:hypothetical protein
MDRQAGAIRDVLVTGDDRPLLTATLNYIQINKGFAKSVMKKAETLKKENEEGIAGINRSITEFGDKERMFAIEVNNAIASSKEEEPEEQIAPEEKPEEDPNTEAEEESPKKSAKEKKTKAKKGEEGSQRRKLPHEIED